MNVAEEKLDKLVEELSKTREEKGKLEQKEIRILRELRSRAFYSEEASLKQRIKFVSYDPVSKNLILDVIAEKHSVTYEEVDEKIEELKREGELFEPAEGMIQSL